eukprot:1499258-Rhodomonas_salina.2
MTPRPPYLSAKSPTPSKPEIPSSQTEPYPNQSTSKKLGMGGLKGEQKRKEQKRKKEKRRKKEEKKRKRRERGRPAGRAGEEDGVEVVPVEALGVLW